jgi:hypothetical protein
MSVEGLNKEQITQLERELINKLPMEVTIGNVMLRTRLRRGDQQYSPIRNKLIDSGRLEKGRGRGRRVKGISSAGVQETSA